jgi:hypothetical protein
MARTKTTPRLPATDKPRRSRRVVFTEKQKKELEEKKQKKQIKNKTNKEEEEEED